MDPIKQHLESLRQELYEFFMEQLSELKDALPEEREKDTFILFCELNEWLQSRVPGFIGNIGAPAESDGNFILLTDGVIGYSIDFSQALWNEPESFTQDDIKISKVNEEVISRWFDAF